MMKWLVVLLFVAGAPLAWGVYVPVVHRAAFELKSNPRAFMLVVFSIRIPSHAASLNSVEERIMQPGDLGPFSSGAQLRLGIDLQGT